VNVAVGRINLDWFHAVRMEMAAEMNRATMGYPPVTGPEDGPSAEKTHT
jgi:hypothetical protein